MIVGVIKNNSLIETSLKKSIKNWKIEKLNKTDLIILKLACFEIKYYSGANFVLKNSSNYSFQNHDDLINIDPKASIKLEIKTIEKIKRLRLPFIVLNALEAPKKNAEIILEYEVGN